MPKLEVGRARALLGALPWLGLWNHPLVELDLSHHAMGGTRGPRQSDSLRTRADSMRLRDTTRAARGRRRSLCCSTKRSHKLPADCVLAVRWCPLNKFSNGIGAQDFVRHSFRVYVNSETDRQPSSELHEPKISKHNSSPPDMYPAIKALTTTSLVTYEII